MHLFKALRQEGRFAGFSLFVSNSSVPENQQNGYLCYKNGKELPPLDFNTSCITHGRYVTFYNERHDKIKYPNGYQLSPVFTELCEVTVTGMVKLLLVPFKFTITLKHISIKIKKAEKKCGFLP